KLGTPDEIKTVIQFEPDPEKFLRQCKDLEKRGLTKLDVSILNNKQKLAFALASLIDELNGETLSHMLSESRKRLMAVGFMVDAEDIETALEPYIKKTDKDILSHTETLEQN